MNIIQNVYLVMLKMDITLQIVSRDLIVIIKLPLIKVILYIKVMIKILELSLKNGYCVILHVKHAFLWVMKPKTIV